MTDFPTLSYTLTCEIPTLLDTWSMKKVPFRVELPHIGHYREYPPSPPRSTFCHRHLWAVTRGGTGTWDAGSRGRRNVGTRGLGDVGTRGRGDSETRLYAWGLADVINKHTWLLRWIWKIQFLAVKCKVIQYDGEFVIRLWELWSWVQNGFHAGGLKQRGKKKRHYTRLGVLQYLMSPWKGKGKKKEKEVWVDDTCYSLCGIVALHAARTSFNF